MLATGSAGPVGIDTEIGFDDFHFDVVADLGKGKNRGKRSMAAGIAIEGGYAYESMNTGLGLEIAVGILTGYGKGAALHAGLIAGLVFGNFGTPTLPFAVAKVHPQEHFSPILGFGTAGARIYGKIAGTAVMWSGKHPLEFCGNQFLFQLFIEFVGFLENGLIFGLAAEFDENLDIFRLALQAVPACQYLLDGGPLAKNDLSLLIVIPEAGCRDAGLYLLDILPFAIYVKETPEAWKSAPRALLPLLPLLCT
jgi:hypothetical protein